MGRQKFCSCPIFFDEPFTRGLIVNGTYPFTEHTHLLLVRVAYIYARHLACHYCLEFEALISTDF